jgi:hypothetical protein
MSHSPEPRAEEGLANIFVTWVPMSPDDAAWTNLVTAFSNYVAACALGANYEASLIPANVAVEARLFRFVERRLLKVAFKRRVKGFLTSNATYNHQLNILLPLIISENIGVPSLPDELRERLNRLNELRNDVAHDGHCTPPLSKDDCAELITASLFAFRYLGIALNAPLLS